MRLFVVAWREAHVPSSLAATGRRIDLDVQVMTPPEAAKAATTDDLVLGYLDVRPTLDGIEPGIAKLRGLGSRGVTVINGPDALRACHDKLVTALRLGRAGLPHPETAYLSAASGRRDVSRLRFPLVVKPRFGSRGEHVAACADPDELGMLLRTLRRQAWFRRHGALLQELVPPPATTSACSSRADASSARYDAWRRPASGGRTSPWARPGIRCSRSRTSARWPWLRPPRPERSSPAST